jgi:NADH:ubiquinone oxidoreductase subunit 4 (subunit M)
MHLCFLAADTNIKQYKQLVLNMLLIQLFLTLTFMTTDLFFFYIFFESILIPMYLIIGIYGSRENKIMASYYFFLYTLLGSFLLLLGILYIYNLTGTTSYDIIGKFPLTQEEQVVLFLCFFFPFAVKVPMLPVHI